MCALVPSKCICAFNLVSKSLPNKGYGQSGTCRKEWVTLPVASCTFRSVVHRYLFPPVAPWTHADFSLKGPDVRVNTECWAPVSTRKVTGCPPTSRVILGSGGGLLASTSLVLQRQQGGLGLRPPWPFWSLWAVFDPMSLFFAIGALVSVYPRASSIFYLPILFLP